MESTTSSFIPGQLRLFSPLALGLGQGARIPVTRCYVCGATFVGQPSEVCGEACAIVEASIEG